MGHRRPGLDGCCLMRLEHESFGTNLEPTNPRTRYGIHTRNNSIGRPTQYGGRQVFWSALVSSLQRANETLRQTGRTPTELRGVRSSRNVSRAGQPMPGCRNSIDPYLDATWIIAARGCSVDQHPRTLEWSETTPTELITSYGNNQRQHSSIRKGRLHRWWASSRNRSVTHRWCPRC